MIHKVMGLKTQLLQVSLSLTSDQSRYKRKSQGEGSTFARMFSLICWNICVHSVIFFLIHKMEII